MKRRLALPMLVTMMMASAACGSSSKSSSSTSTTIAGGATRTTACSTSAPTTTVQGSATSTAAKPALATLHVATNKKLNKKIVVTAAGRTVYMFVPDGASPTSKVPAALQPAWPAVTASGKVTVGPGMAPTKAAACKQPNGVQQVSYNDHLLYTYRNDKRPTAVNGQGLAGKWYVLSPSGQKIG